ncbi:MAG: amidohydrolase family protein [Sinimarinibacterium sp.]
MLIRRAEIAPAEIVDVRINDARIVEIAPQLEARADDREIDAGGHALLPGLHDHHIHLRALAASLASVRCGSPQVVSADQLVAALAAADARLGAGDWLRGVQYHESIAGEIDRDWLDAVLPDRPLRIQHRSGRLWILNSAALDRLAPGADAPLESRDGRWTGRLYDADDWLRECLRSTPPSLHAASHWLASRGVTGVTDTTHHNGPIELHTFAQARRNGQLLQTVRVMGDARLDLCGDLPGVQRGEHKFHLHEHELPDIEGLVAAIRDSHSVGRAVAFHCVTRTDLVFALAALREAGPLKGDRIEHAAIAPPELVEQIAALKLIVVTQPNFIAERGDDYLRDVDAADQPWLYRLRGFTDAGVPLAGSTDAPFGGADPWSSMQAAVTRCTPSGATLGGGEALQPTAALNLFLSPLEAPALSPRRIEIDATADLCLLDRGHDAALLALDAARVQLTLVAGRVIHDAEREPAP